MPTEPTTPGLDDTLKRHKRTINEAWKTLPRFLFGAWSSKSGGSPRLNTPKAVTPIAFLHRQPLPFYQMPESKLKKPAIRHVKCSRTSFDTCYSSWSQSLDFVLSWETDRYLGSSNAHVAVLDTSLLNPENVIFSVATARDVFGWEELPDYYLFEFLICDIVDGPAYCAVPYHSLLDAGLLAFIPPGGLNGFGYEDPHDPGEVTFGDISGRKIEVAHSIANLYPKDFQLLIALHLLSVNVDVRKEKEKVLLGLMGLRVPRHWKNDKRLLLASRMKLAWLPDTLGAAEILEHLAKNGISQHKEPGTLAEKDNRRTLLEDIEIPETTGAPVNIEEAMRQVPAQGPEVGQLYTLMVGGYREGFASVFF